MRPFPAAITALAVALCTVTSSAAGAAGPRPALVDRGTFGGPVVSAAQDPGAPATLLVSAGNGVYRTSDAARHWTCTKLPGPAVVAFAPSEAACAYAMPWQPLKYVAGSVWRSQDAGATWIKGGQPTGGPGSSLVLSPPDGPVSSLVVPPHDEQVVYAVFNASSPPEVSVNAGDSWRRLGSVGLPVD